MGEKNQLILNQYFSIFHV